MRLGFVGVSLLLFLSSSYVHAARDWAFQDVYVDDVLVYSMSGYNVVTVKMKDVGQINTGCAQTDQHHIVSYWTTGGLGSNVQTWVSLLLSAQAQKFPVNLLVEMNTCSTGAEWDAFGSPEGLGLKLFGVRVIK
ncbi:MAG: hypothetical protein VYC49_08275 [Pseudomonadota bacterium]|jgi:hypothetical protein|uniref:hypothetical protein n=1 Tax=Alloalcanivorax venustensis TaxID=172371 RepID=UPI002E982FA0|nr:hypothetical protein [Pseudomonadota bacterium]|tara:strand:+ start:77579 stop:77980 length:402 start_codon:yes stop_codon:yes gene_type:complete